MGEKRVDSKYGFREEKAGARREQGMPHVGKAQKERSVIIIVY